MVVFAAAGLEATVSYLLRDLLEKTRPPAAVSEMKKWSQRELGESEGRRLLAEILVSTDPQKACVDKFLDHLTGGSLQSYEALRKAAEAMGLNVKDLRHLADPDRARNAFALRNRIVHEFDVDMKELRRGNPNRRGRRLKAMKTAATFFLNAANDFIQAAEKVLRDSGASVQAGGDQ